MASKKLTPEQIATIRRLGDRRRADRVSQVNLSRRFGVSVQLISAIMNGHRYA